MLRSSLPGGRGDDVDAAIEHVLRVLEHDVPFAAAKKLAEQFAEVTANQLERLGEQPPALVADAPQDFLERPFRLDEVGQLLAQMSEAAFQLLEVAKTFGVDAAHQLELSPQPGDARLELFPHVLESRRLNRLGGGSSPQLCVSSAA